MAFKLEGIVPPVLTPFDAQENFDPGAMRVLLDYLIGHGTHAIFVVGSVSEFYALRMDEVKEIIRTTVAAVRGRVPVVAGAGAIATRDAIELSRFAQDAGVDALSILTPFFIKPNDEELYQHYAAIAQAVEIPVLGYTNPDRAGGVTLSPALMQRLTTTFENIVGIKDSSADLTNMLDFQRLCPPGFLFFTGRDTLIFDTVLNDGAGAVSGLANVAPALVVSIYEHARAGRLEEAKQAQRQLAPLRAAYGLGTFPVVLKEMAALLGLPVGPTRRPGLPLSPAVRQRLREMMSAVLGPEVFETTSG